MKRPENFLYNHRLEMRGLYAVNLNVGKRTLKALTNDLDAIERIEDMRNDANVYTHKEIQQQYHDSFFFKFEAEYEEENL